MPYTKKMIVKYAVSIYPGNRKKVKCLFFSVQQLCLYCSLVIHGRTVAYLLILCTLNYEFIPSAINLNLSLNTCLIFCTTRKKNDLYHKFAIRLS